MKNININPDEIKIFQEFLEDLEKGQHDTKDIVLTDMQICSKICMFYLQHRTDILNELFALKSRLDVLMEFLKNNEHLFNDELKQNAKDHLCAITQTINTFLFKNKKEIDFLLSEAGKQESTLEELSNDASEKTIH